MAPSVTCKRVPAHGCKNSDVNNLFFNPHPTFIHVDPFRHCCARQLTRCAIPLDPLPCMHQARRTALHVATIHGSRHCHTVQLVAHSNSTETLARTHTSIGPQRHLLGLLPIARKPAISLRAHNRPSECVLLRSDLLFTDQ